MESIWSKTIEKSEFDILRGDTKTDVLIIGGGITGLLSAYILKKAGVNSVIVEADKICGGITKNTTAKVTLQHGLIYDKILKKYGLEAAQLYFKAQQSALTQYRGICQEFECDFTECSSFVYSKDNIQKLEDEIKAMKKIGLKGEFVDKIPLPLSVVGAVKVENQAQINPLKLLYGLAGELKIYEKTKVLEVIGNRAVTNNGDITFKKAIVATHFPFINKYGWYFLKMYQHRSYVVALKGTQKISDMYVDEAINGLSFRMYDDLLLLGGGSHRTGKQGGNWAELGDFAKKNYPNSKEVYRWATQDCMTLDGIGYIGKYSNQTPNLFVATGFNKWGMSSSMVAAMLLKDLILENENDFSGLFSPSRSILHPQLAVNIKESLTGLLTLTSPRCPHMGCALKYNKHEHSWDCSCHGSRFTKDGKLIDNPATDNKN